MSRWPVKTIEQRFWEKVGPHTDSTKCWLWTAATIQSKKLSYGRIKVGGVTVLAHRLSYAMHYHVVIPPGMTIDHVKERGCTSTLCVNPYHLEVVTGRINTLRGVGVAALEVKRMQCPQGHPYNKENTYVWHEQRFCRVCRRERQKE